jgi:ATP-dependent DNA ligase
MVSRKLDGVRTIGTIENGQVKFYSRTGSIFQTLSTLVPQVEKILNEAKIKYGEEFILDGECCLIKEDGKDDFAGIMKEITRKNHTIANPKYVVFDLIKKKEFEAGVGTTVFKQRMKMLEELHVEKFGEFVSLISHANSINKETYFK